MLFRSDARIAVDDAGEVLVDDRALHVDVAEQNAVESIVQHNIQTLQSTHSGDLGHTQARAIVAQADVAVLLLADLVERGAVGKVYMLKQAEKHSGPHSAWFYKEECAGGGVMMDMGCHALAWFRWMTGNAKVKSVYSDMKTVFHNDITTCEDNTVTIVEFENGVTAVAEDSWAKHGGMDDRIEVYGDKGVSYADLFRGNSALTYSTEGYDYAMEKAGSTQGWTFTVFEEAFNQGYPQELAHFIHCVRTGEKPLVTGEDGRAVLEMVYAAYASAKEGRKIALPFSAKVKYPIELMR